jgi:nucleoside-diphosphate-sugar epimerase
MRILVTGGAGAIGGNLCRRLLAEGAAITVLDDLSSGHAANLPSGVRFVHGSVLDPAAIEEAFSSAPEFVYHLAALFANQNSVEHPDRDLAVNGGGTIAIFEAARRHGVRKTLNVSSSCVYGNVSPMIETVPTRSNATPYAVTKGLGEHYASFFSRHHGMAIVSVRLFNSYGPGEWPGPYRNVIPNMIESALADRPLTITGTGEETRDFTFVEDTVEGMIRAMTAVTDPGAVFNIGSGTGVLIRDLVGAIIEATGSRSEVRQVPPRSWDTVTDRVAVIEKARRLLGYDPRFTLREGLARTVDWFKSLPVDPA